MGPERMAISFCMALLFCFVFLLLTTPAEAQSPRQMLQEIDANRDGKIQFSELRSFRAAAFDRIDSNRNGVADPSELNALKEQAARNGRASPANLDPRASDTNGDGVITRQEFANYLPPRTLNADRNRDGALSRSEMRSLR